VAAFRRGDHGVGRDLRHRVAVEQKFNSRLPVSLVNVTTNHILVRPVPLVKFDSAELNLMSLRLTLVRPIIEHKINRHGGRSWKRQRPLDKTHDYDDDDDDDAPLRTRYANRPTISSNAGIMGETDRPCRRRVVGSRPADW